MLIVNIFLLPNLLRPNNFHISNKLDIGTRKAGQKICKEEYLRITKEILKKKKRAIWRMNQHMNYITLFHCLAFSFCNSTFNYKKLILQKKKMLCGLTF